MRSWSKLDSDLVGFDRDLMGIWMGYTLWLFDIAMEHGPFIDDFIMI